MKRFFLSLFFLLTTLLTFAQNSITGSVTDENNEPLIGATIMVQGTTKGASSDFEGKFTIGNLSAGTYAVSVGFLGYTEIVKEVTINGADVDLGTISLQPDAVGLKEVSIIASVAVDRKTPVAVTTIPTEVIEVKVGNQEFPEVLKSTPSVYTTKSGGGFGDARMNIRGFDQRNTAVLINGIPVNDMENGWVYWSNWAGLSDVTRSMQVQRGLGASKLAISSIGGTVNIVTKTTDQKKGGSISYAFGNDNFQKKAITLSTGRLDNGLAITFSGSRTTGDGYVDATWIDAWGYFLSVSKEFGKKHQLSFTAIGAPQRHGQRDYSSFAPKLSDYDFLRDKKYNSDWGYRKGQMFNVRENFYHKPQLALNHYWNVSDKTFLATSAYYSIGLGGGTGDRGSIGGKNIFNAAYKDGTGQMRIDDIVSWNSGTGALAGFPATGNINNATYGFIGNESNGILKRASMNNHIWFGGLSTIEHTFNEKFTLYGGIDLRHYRGIHYRMIVDMMGLSSWLEPNNINNKATEIDVNGNGVLANNEKGFIIRGVEKGFTIENENNKINYDNDGIVDWQGAFATGEYNVSDRLTVFFSGALSNTTYKREDRFLLTPAQGQVSDAKSFIGYTLKAGGNFNINNQNNVFLNVGNFARAPFFRTVFPNNTNVINEGAETEKITAFELGYGYRSHFLSANLNLYKTIWKDKSLYLSSAAFAANILGVKADHQGIELDFVAKPITGLSIRGAASIGDWKWKSNASAVLVDDNTQQTLDVTLYLKDIKVSDAAQTQVGLGLQYDFPFGLSLDADYTYFDNLYAAIQFGADGALTAGNINSLKSTIPRINPELEGVQPLKLPSYDVVDLGVSYKFKIKDLDSRIRINVNNLFDASNIVEAFDNTSITDYDADANNNKYNGNYKKQLYDAVGLYGFGRTYNASIKISF